MTLDDLTIALDDLTDEEREFVAKCRPATLRRLIRLENGVPPTKAHALFWREIAVITARASGGAA